MYHSWLLQPKVFTENGWLKTNDIFTADEEGNYCLVKRVKDKLKISGVQVFPSVLEIALMDQPEGLIKGVVVTDVSGGRASDEKAPRAWIVPSQAGKRKGAAATIEAPEEFLRRVRGHH